MAKKETAYIKLQIPAAKPIRRRRLVRLWASTVSILWNFVRTLTHRTQSMGDTIVPVVITGLPGSFFQLHYQDSARVCLVVKAAGLQKGSSNPKVDRVAEISREKIREIAEMKMPDFNAYDINSAMRIVEGTARSAGITIID